MRTFAILAILLNPQGALACFKPDSLGSFQGDVDGRFVSKPYADRPLFQLSKPLTYKAPSQTEFTAIKDYIVDGASIPRLLWTVIGGPFSGNHLKASVVHDYYTDTCQFHAHPEEGRACQNQLTQFPDDTVVHRNYYLGMLESGVDADKACAEYVAVSLYKSWDIDEHGKPINIEILGVAIDDTDSNLWDKTLGLVSASIAGIIKTRKASNGALLNIFPDAEIPLTEEGFQEYLRRFGDALRDESYLNNPDLLGLLTDENLSDIDHLQAWPESFWGQLYDPKANQFEGLTYFDPQRQFSSSPLRDDLQLDQPDRVFIESFTEEDLTNLDEATFTNILVNQLNNEFSNEIPRAIETNDLSIFLNESSGVVEYFVSPELRGAMSGSPDTLNLGRSGYMYFGDSIEGGQGLAILPNPGISYSAGQ